MRLVDTHAHLAMLEHDPLENILTRARTQGVYRMISVSTDEGSWESNRNLAYSHEDLYFTLGLHPHDAIRWVECAAKLDSFFVDGKPPKKCVAIGEMGLDFHYDFCPREIQVDVFESQLMVAKKYDLPVVIHCRDAFEQLFISIEKVGLGSRGGVLHCFTGTLEDALRGIEMGLKVSFSGIVTFKNAEGLRETAKHLPADSLLVETDCPYLAPMPFRGKPNEPAFLPMTVQTLALARNAQPEEIAELTTKNALEFFQLK